MRLQEFKKKPIYLDMCSLCRSFDDKQFMRIRLETAAVELIMEHIKTGDYTLYYSSAHRFEIENFEDLYERAEVQDFLDNWGLNADKYVSLRNTRHRADELADNGFSVADAVHTAFAEALKASFITCDDKLIKKCRRYKVNTWFGTPLEFCEMEEIR